MGAYSWTLGTASTAADASGVAKADRDAASQFLGVDLHLGYDDQGVPRTELTAAGDYMLASGVEALRQSIVRRVLTVPGEWSTIPAYGAGAVAYVKGRDTTKLRSELVSNIRSQLQADPRISETSSVDIARVNDALRITMNVKPKRYGADRDITASVEISR